MGGTSHIAEHCARIWAQNEAVDLFLLGRDTDKLALVAKDLRVRSPQSNVTTLTADFLDCESIARSVHAMTVNGNIDLALIAQGTLPDQATCQKDLNLIKHVVDINGISPILFAEALANHFESAGAGTLVVLGSVAGDRGRKSNYTYGAAKGLLARYTEGLQHRFANTKIKVVLVKPGPTKSPMTAHLNMPNLASAEEVASKIVSAAESGVPVLYAPRKWQIIMMIIRHLPATLFNRLNI